MFKELLLTICLGILLGFLLFIRTQNALKEAYNHHIRSKYASNCHIASKYPQLNDDNEGDDERDKVIEHKFYKPPLYTDPLFNPKSLETAQLRSEFFKLFGVLNTIRDYIIRDFIDYWYKTAISSDDTKFINHIKCTIDGAFQVLIKRISSTNWTYFMRDRIFHPLRECLTLYRNIVKDLSKKNPKWNELTENERDNFIADVIDQRYQWHKGCDSSKASIEYLRKWSLLFVEEILDERNFHCFAVRFFCRELITNNILFPIINLVDGYNVNRAIVEAFIYLKQNEETLKDNDVIPSTEPMDIDENIQNEVISSNIKKQKSQSTETQETISEKHIVSETKDKQNIEENKDNTSKKPIITHKRKRRASLDTNILDHYHKSFKINYFFIEINQDQSELLELTPFIERDGYSISCKYEIESQYKFTIRFVSTQCVNLCARWVTLVGDNLIFSDSSSLKHLKCTEYEGNKFIYIWSDHKLHEYGDCYLQIGREMIVSTDIQRQNKRYNMRYTFVPCNIPLLHIDFTVKQRTEPINETNHANTSISEGLAKFGNAINPLTVIDNIGDGIKKLLPNDKSPQKEIKTPKQKRTLFGKMKKDPSFHHDIEDIGFLTSNSKKSLRDNDQNKKMNKKKKIDKKKLKLLARHKPTRNLTIRIWDVYRDFDHNSNPHVAYVLRMRDEMMINDKVERIEWTIKTRFRKLYSFHRAIQKDKSLKHKRIKIVAQFPAKSLITKMDPKSIAERKKQLVAYFNTLHRYPDVLLCNTVYQLVIPPVLVQNYKEKKLKPKAVPPIAISKESNGFLNSTHPILPSSPYRNLKDLSPYLSLPTTVIGSETIPYFNDESEDDDEEMSITRPRRGSYSGMDTLYEERKSEWINNTRLQRKISVINIENQVLNVEDDDMNLINDCEKESDEDKERERDNTDKLDRFQIEHYEHITPSLIKVLEAFLDLEKRSTFGSSLTMAATSMMKWFFNGYIAHKLYAHSASLTMDGTLSYLMQWISDLIWIPPQYQMNEEEVKAPSDHEMEELRAKARECIQQLFEEYIGDNVFGIIGQKKQLEPCMIKLWRFMQQNRLLKHLAFSILDALLQDLFIERVSRRYQRRAWIADKNRKREANINKKRNIKKDKQKIVDRIDLFRAKSYENKKKIRVKENNDNNPPSELLNKGSLLSQSVDFASNQFLRSNSRPLLMGINGNAPNIDIFSGGSLLSDYTKKFILNFNKESSDEEDMESTDSDDDNDDGSEEANVWNNGFTYYSDDDQNRINKYNKHNGVVFHKLIRNQKYKNKKNGQLKPEHWMIDV